MDTPYLLDLSWRSISRELPKSHKISVDARYSRDMSHREFWNLAGRAGRVGQDNVGVVGIACDTAEKERDIIMFKKVRGFNFSFDCYLEVAGER